MKELWKTVDSWILMVVPYCCNSITLCKRNWNLHGEKDLRWNKGQIPLNLFASLYKRLSQKTFLSKITFVYVLVGEIQ